MTTTRALAGIVLLALLSGCGTGTTTDPGDGASSPPDAATSPATTDDATGADADTEADADAPLVLEDEATFLAFLAAVLDWSFGLTPDDGTIEVLESMEGYGALRWTTQDVAVVLTHRQVADEWEWVYVDEGIVVDSVTEDSLSADEAAAFQALADALVAAMGVDGPADLRYGFRHPDGPMQADFVVGTAEGDASMHVSTDAEGRVGRIDVDWPGI